LRLRQERNDSTAIYEYYASLAVLYLMRKAASMKKRIAVAFLLLFGAMFTVEGTQDRSPLRASAQERLSLAAKPPALLDCSFISPLDSHIQDRFTQKNLGFGIERVPIVPGILHTPISSMESYSKSKTIGMFAPGTDQEREAVGEIERSGLKMVLYLASRNILVTEPDEPVRFLSAPHAPLRGPVAITQGSQKIDWPEMSRLWKQARKAMQEFDADKSATQYEFSAEGKDFIARPVRAQESCLECHSPRGYQSPGHGLNSDGSIRRLSVSDPIGVLLYAYTASAKSTNIKIP
jgi:hypothetical protein